MRDRIYNDVRAWIENGHLTTGHRLTETELAERFGVSRTPVREALFQLVREGLLEAGDKGYGTPEVSTGAIRERLLVRKVLDPALAAHVATAATPRQGELLLKAAHTALEACDRAPVVFAGAVHRYLIVLATSGTDAALMRCCTVLENDFIIARIELFGSPYLRTISRAFLASFSDYLCLGDSAAASEIMSTYIDCQIRACDALYAPSKHSLQRLAAPFKLNTVS
ncbi:GntR family transcriptional regulator [Cupriavidus basilensis]